jgi:hypothetical protein
LLPPVKLNLAEPVQRTAGWGALAGASEAKSKAMAIPALRQHLWRSPLSRG